jgi:ribosomal protein S18 acetylase RimI-like enzyme
VAREEDEHFLWRMLAEAAHEPTVQSVKDDPDTARYVEGWGRRHDLGFVAEGLDGELFGAIWQRLFAGDSRGFGYVDDQTPEFGIAVRPEYRDLGIGLQLLGCLLDESLQRSYPALSLSVRTDNPAMRIYQRAGFAVVEGSEITNRAGGTSAVMLLELG